MAPLQDWNPSRFRVIASAHYQQELDYIIISFARRHNIEAQHCSAWLIKYFKSLWSVCWLRKLVTNTLFHISTCIDDIKLDPPTLAAFRLCSRHCRDAADSIFFRHISLRDCRDHDEDDQQEIPTSSVYIDEIVQRLTETDGDLKAYVRDLEIGPFRNHELPPNLSSEILLQILGSLTNLRDFRWNVCSKLPSDVLATLHRSWPHCRLHVSQQHRIDDNLDQELLGSPQLVALDMTIIRDSSWATPYTSEYPILTDLITRHRSLKKLVLRHKSLSCPKFGTDGPLQLRVQPDTQLPNLEELAIPWPYEADELHVSRLMHAMDWSFLQRLDFTFSPGFLIKALTGFVPQLKSLSMSFYGAWRSGNLFSVEESTMVAFIRSIDALEKVSLKNGKSTLAEAVWPIMLDVHGKSLRELAVDWGGSDRSLGLNRDSIQVLAEKVPGLEVVSLSLALVQVKGGRYGWPQESIHQLIKMPNLRRIELFISMDGDNFSQFLGSEVHFKVDLARDAVNSMIAFYNNRNPGNGLEFVKVVFKRSSRSAYRKWTLTARRQHSIDGTSRTFPVHFEVFEMPVPGRYRGYDVFE